MQQQPLALMLTSAPTFESFVPGPNAAALAALVQGPQAALTYLHGGAGSGKTHLLRALAGWAQQAGLAVGWLDAASAMPWAVQREWSLLLIDGVDAFDAARQHRAFVAYVEAATLALPIVASGRLAPADAPVREDLRSRLGWGDVLALQPLAEPDLRAALAAQARQRGMQLDAAVLDYVLARARRDWPHLLAWLDALDAAALVQQRQVTVPLAREVLAQMEPPA